MISFVDREQTGCVTDRLKALGYVRTTDRFTIGRPDRSTFALRAPDGRAAVAKVYPPGQAQIVFSQWQCVWNSGFGRMRVPPGIPEPLACFTDIGVLVTELVAGRPLAAMPIRDADLDASVQLVAELHSSDIKPTRRRSSRSILRSLGRKLQFIDAAAPQHAERMRRVVTRLAALRPGDEEFVPSHGDCSPRNVLVSAERRVLIDWDRLQLADPARDLAYFGVWNWKQDLRNGRQPDRRPLERVVKVYTECRPSTRIRNRLHFHMAAGLVRQAVSIVQLWPDEMNLVPPLLELAMEELGVKVTILSHNLSSNAVMRSHRLAVAAQRFAEVQLIGPVESKGLWPALPHAPWVRTVVERRLPKFYRSMLELVDMADGDVLIACKPQLGSYGVALMTGELKQRPVILDLDDLDIAFMPRAEWAKHPVMADPRRHGSAVYVSLLTRAAGAAAAITTSSSALQRRFGGTLVPQGCMTELFDPATVDWERARRELGFAAPTLLFAGTPRSHKGLKPLAHAVKNVAGAQLAVVCRAKDLAEDCWLNQPVLRLPMVPYPEMPRLLAAADIVAIPQLDTEASRYQMPIKVFDAMAMGKPIVASAISDLPSVLQGCGRLVPPGDVDQLSQVIQDFLEQPEQAQALGRRARERCLQEFSMQRVAEVLKGVVDSVLARGVV